VIQIRSRFLDRIGRFDREFDVIAEDIASNPDRSEQDRFNQALILGG